MVVSQRFMGLAMVMGLVLSGLATANGADTSWNVSSGDWSVGSNWTAGVPDSTLTAQIVNGGTAQITQAENCAGFYVGNTAGTGAVQMTGGSLTSATGYAAYLGYNTHSGDFAQFAGTVTIGNTGAAGDNLYVGLAYSNSTDISTYTLSGGTLSVGWQEAVSWSGGVGHFIQSGTSVNSTSYLRVGHVNAGTYELQGGSLTAFQLLGGDAGGACNFIQTGGTFTVTGNMFVAAYYDGNYTISGGTLTASDFEVGYGGTGTVTVIGGNSTINVGIWNQFGSATNPSGNVLNCQFDANGISTINVSGTADIGGTLTVTDPNGTAPQGRFNILTAGGGLSGTFSTVNLPDSINWSWGIDTATNAVWIQHGAGAPVTDTYWAVPSGNWSGSSNWTAGVPTSAVNAHVDNDGTVSITQGGEACNGLYLGNLTGNGTGTVQMTAGDLTTSANGYVGYLDNPGTFNQSEGTVTVGAAGGTVYLYIGYGGTGSGVSTYTLSGGALNVPYFEYVSRSGGKGHFIQSGVSTHTPTYLEVGHGYTGLYELQGGSLSVFQLLLGESCPDGNEGDFIQTGGTCTGGYVFVGYLAAGSYTISGGTLAATGSEGDIELGYGGVNGTFTVIGSNATMNANYWNLYNTVFSGNVLNCQFDANGISTINVIGTANIGGTLNVTDPNGNAPLGRYSILTAGGSLTGTFDTVNLPSSAWSWGIDSATQTVWVQNGSGAVAATPTFTPDSGNYSSLHKPLTVTLACTTPGATIRYTTDGSAPTLSGPSGTSVTISANTTLKAKAWAAGYIPSAIGSATYVFPTSYSRPVNIPFGTAKMDGSLSEWADATWAPIDQPYYPDNISWPTDIPRDNVSCYYAAKWTPNKIYLAIKVRDTDHQFTAGYNPWDGHDGLEIFLHTTGTGPADGYYSTYADAQQYAVGFMPGGLAMWSVLGGGPDLPTAAGFSVAGTISGEWLYYEVAMTPFNFFDSSGATSVVSTLKPGDVVGLDVVVAAKSSSNFWQISENQMKWKSADYSTFGLHVLTDLNGDGKLTSADLSILLAAMDTVRGHPGFDARADLDGDGEVTSTDLSILLADMD